MDGPTALKGLAAVGLLLAGTTVSCAIDSRQLSTANGAGSSAAAGTSSLAGDGGDGGAALPSLPACDYGSGVEGGCETLVANPGFSTDTAGWKAEDTTVAMAWRANDAGENSHSGSLSVVNSLYGTADGFASRAAAQCLPTQAGKTYGFGLDVFIPKGQGEGLEGSDYRASAGLSVIFYTSKNCDEFTLDSASSELLQAEDRWTHREGRAVAPQGAQSMSVRLVTLKNFQEYSFEAYFDNVLVKVE